jgi:hypothetical protein
MLDQDFFDRLNKFLVDHPASDTRWFTTERRNKAIGGAKDSAHLFKYGNGIDLVFDSDEELYTAAANAHRYGFQGIELDMTNKHLHLDTKPRVWRVVYHGKKNGKRHETSLDTWRQEIYPTLITPIVA